MAKSLLERTKEVYAYFNDGTQKMARKRKNKNHKAIHKKHHKPKASGGKAGVNKLPVPVNVKKAEKPKGGGSVYYGNYHKDCHGGELQRAFVIGKVKFWLGAKADFKSHPLSATDDWTLAINLTGFGTMALPPVVDYNAKAREILPPSLLKVSKGTAELSIDWPDGGVPYGIRDSWYQTFVDWVLTQEYGDIAICCLGGHGRTGTLAVILAGLAGLIPAGVCPVGWLRQRYCENVVETTAQIAMIERVLKRRVTESGAWESSLFSKDPNKPKQGWHSQVKQGTGPIASASVGSSTVGTTHTISDSGCLVPKIGTDKDTFTTTDKVIRTLEEIDPSGLDWVDLLDDALDAAYEKQDWELVYLIEESLADLKALEADIKAQAQGKFSNGMDSSNPDREHFSDLKPYGQTVKE